MIFINKLHKVFDTFKFFRLISGILFFLDVELPKATNTSALSGKGVMRLFNKVGETVNKITYKMDESDMVRFLQYKHISSCMYFL